VDKAGKIGFCFSYPSEILPSGDGRLIRFSKEVQADGVEGELVGKGLLEAVAAQGRHADKSVVLLNDTVATLLGGKAARANRQYGSYIGFILGTGTNTCYIERSAAITKVPSLDQARSMIINIESGAYGRAPQGTVDRELDARTVNPGEHLFEKMISGGYFGDMTLLTLKKAAASGLFTGACAARIKALSAFATRDANEFLEDSCGAGVLAACCEGEADRAAAWYLLDGLFERAAKFVAINLSTVIMKSSGGADPCRPVLVTAEGTMFNKSKSFRRKLDYYIKDYLEDTLGLYCEFIEVENATLLGTAIAGLTGCV
jgi:hexokinase